jgi:hypothetical protein
MSPLNADSNRGPVKPLLKLLKNIIRSVAFLTAYI